MIRPSFQPQVLSESRIAHDAPVLPAYAATPYAASLPLFGDDLWDMRVLRVRRNQRPEYTSIIDFRLFADTTRRLVAKEYLYARLNIKHPQHCPLAVTGMKTEYYLLRRFFTYLDTVWDGVRLADVTQTMLDAYLLACRLGEKGQVLKASAVQERILIPIKLAAYHTAFSTDALTLEPWKGKSAHYVVGTRRSAENTTPRIPEAVLGPLIQWALFYVQIAAKDILAAHAELAGYQRASSSSDVLTSRSARLEAWIAARRATGRGLPASAPRYHAHHKGPDSALHGVNWALVATHGWRWQYYR